jgi:anti-anti-sigma factor
VSISSNHPRFSCARQTVSGDRQHVVAVGEIDLASGPRLTGILREAQRDARHVELDLSRTTFIDASGARILLDARVQARANAATFEITGLTSPVRRLMDLIGPHTWNRPRLPPKRTGAGDGARADLPPPARVQPSPLLRYLTVPRRWRM